MTVELAVEPIRNEANSARAAMLRFLEQRHPGLNIELVNDAIGSSDEARVGSLRTLAFRVLAPFLVTYTREEGQIVAHAAAFNEFGFGSDYFEALRDLQQTIVELYLSLEATSDRLGPDLLATWQALQVHIRRVR